MVNIEPGVLVKCEELLTNIDNCVDVSLEISLCRDYVGRIEFTWCRHLMRKLELSLHRHLAIN